MIARHWRGWTPRENAEVYERFLRQRVFPQLEQIPGHQGVWLLRRDAGSESEFIVLNLFDSLAAVRQFAGEEYGIAVIEPEAKALLCRWEEVAEHYEVR
ncbi:MAG TPA: hypothetical protein VMD25_11105 [Acidobacteriaceae bacterium]|nr:hypothetical protein [Acidobacteriaceae bacterium]